jgi:hypothetical protein
MIRLQVALNDSVRCVFSTGTPCREGSPWFADAENPREKPTHTNGLGKNASSGVPLWTGPGAEGARQVAVGRLDDGEGAVLPFVEEAPHVGRRRVENGRVRTPVATEVEPRIVRGLAGPADT